MKPSITEEKRKPTETIELVLERSPLTRYNEIKKLLTFALPSYQENATDEKMSTCLGTLLELLLNLNSAKKEFSGLSVDEIPSPTVHACFIYVCRVP